MDALTHRFFTRILYISLVLGGALLLFNPSQRLPALLLYGLFTGLILFHHRRYYTAERKDPRGRYFLVAELLLAFLIQFFDHTRFVEIYVFIVIGDALLAYPPKFSYPFTFAAMSFYSAMLWVKTTTRTPLDFWLEIDASLFAASIFIAVMIAARYNIQMSRQNRQMAQALREKTMELEAANEKLKSYAADLEQTADLKARQVLIMELHDQLGHLLTTAAVSLQASMVLMDRDQEAVRERLTLVTEQLQTAMQSLRSLLRGHEKDHSPSSSAGFIDRLIQLLEETQVHTGIQVDHNLEELDDSWCNAISPYERTFLYHALMEGLTNGIRHGNATHFTFQLTFHPHELDFFLQDNGTGFVTLKPGCGVTKMREDAHRLGAELHIHCDKGCRLHIRLPIKNGAMQAKTAERR